MSSQTTSYPIHSYPIDRSIPAALRVVLIELSALLRVAIKVIQFFIRLFSAIITSFLSSVAQGSWHLIVG